MPAEPPRELLEMMAGLAAAHHDHEEFYSQAPLKAAVDAQGASRILKALAARWSESEPESDGGPAASPFAAAPDLNAPGLVTETGVLFMEDDEEPAEIRALKRSLETAAEDMEASSAWLENAMNQAWAVAGAAVGYPALADVIGERHRIIANDLQSAGLQGLVARLLRRALEILARVDMTPSALRADLAAGREAPDYLFSASELIDRAADLMAESALLVHDSERRWRVFSVRVADLLGGDLSPSTR